MGLGPFHAPSAKSARFSRRFWNQASYSPYLRLAPKTLLVAGPRKPAQVDSRRSESASNRSQVPTLQPRKACLVLGSAHSNLDAWSTKGTRVRVPTKPSKPSRPSAGSARPSLL